MAGHAGGGSLKGRFDEAARRIELRMGHWPVWLKLLVFAPVLLALTAVLVAVLYGLGAVLGAAHGHPPHP